MGIISKIYSLIVNLNQWFYYGRSWLNLPVTLLTSLGSISILIIYFGIEQSAELLVILGILFVGINIGIGLFLFRKKGQQIDTIMYAWRSPLPNLNSVAINFALIGLAEKFEIPIPDQLKDWGVQSWNDLRKINYYILQQGEKAYAKTICQQYFSIEK